MKSMFNYLVSMFGAIGIAALLSNAALANNIMPSFSTVTPTPNPAGWGNSGAVLGIDLYSLDKIDGFQGRDNVLQVIVPAGTSPSILQTVGGEHAVLGRVGTQLEAYLWVPGSWEKNTGPDGKVDTDMLGIMPLSVLPPSPYYDPPEYFLPYSYFPAIGFSNELGDGTFKVWDASRTSPTDPTPNYTCGYPTIPNAPVPKSSSCWVDLDGTANDRGGSVVPKAPVHYDAWNKLTIDFTPDFNIVYSVNDVPVYTGIMDILGLWDANDISSYYGFTAAQMRGLYLGSDYVAHWASVDEPTTLTLFAIGLALLEMVRVHRRRENGT